jgi:hypothetical protein
MVAVRTTDGAELLAGFFIISRKLGCHIGRRGSTTHRDLFSIDEEAITVRADDLMISDPAFYSSRPLLRHLSASRLCPLEARK